MALGKDELLTPPDEELVDLVLAGKIAAFDQLVLRYQKKLYSVLYNMTSNHDDTNDLLMETFDKAYRNLFTFKKQSSFYTWIYTIAVHKAINHSKRNSKTSNNFSLNDLDTDEGSDFQLTDLSSAADPEKQAHLKELQIHLNESLQKLSEEHRAVVVLFDIEGMSHAEITKILRCTEGTVRSRLHYAHKQLKKYLEKFVE